MTDQELQAAEASRTDWYARAEARGVTADHVRPGVELDTWAALNPGTDWAANEDSARTEHQGSSANTLVPEHYAFEWTQKEQWAYENAETNAETRAAAAAQASEFRQGWEDASRQIEADDRAADVARWDAAPTTDYADDAADVA